jgi:large subunit ribosomal protein L11
MDPAKSIRSYRTNPRFFDANRHQFDFNHCRIMSKKGAATAASVVKLWVNAGQATPSPPIGSTLGQRGVKAIDFCKQFNDATKDITAGTPMRVFITVRPDRTFSYVVRPPMTSWFLKKAAAIEKGAGQPGHEVAGSVSLKHVFEIARVKSKDPELSDVSLQKICAQIAGSARSMGIKVVP